MYLVYIVNPLVCVFGLLVEQSICHIVQDEYSICSLSHIFPNQQSVVKLAETIYFFQTDRLHVPTKYDIIMRPRTM